MGEDDEASNYRGSIKLFHSEDAMDEGGAVAEIPVQAKSYHREHKLYEDHETVGCFEGILAYFLRRRTEMRNVRLHYLVEDYKRKVVAFEIQRRETIAAEEAENERRVNREHERIVLRAARGEREVMLAMLFVA